MGKQYAQLMVEERVEIYRLHVDGKSRRAIASGLGRSAATISRELRRNSLATMAWVGGYSPVRAQALPTTPSLIERMSFELAIPQ